MTLVLVDLERNPKIATVRAYSFVCVTCANVCVKTGLVCVPTAKRRKTMCHPLGTPKWVRTPLF